MTSARGNVFQIGIRRLSACLCVAAFVTACSGPEPASPSTTPSPTPSSTVSTKTPELEVTTVTDGLEYPWDLAVLPGGGLIFTERDRERVSILGADGERRTVLESPSGMWHSGETGLMGIDLAPDFESSREFITCHGYQSGGTRDVRVVLWELDESMQLASKVRELVTGLPSSSGRHGGCSLAVSNEGALFVGTGDAAVGTNPQDLQSGGGKVLRVDPATGEGLDDNPFADSPNEMTRRIWSYGHRNVQGLAFNEAGDLWSAEHGPDVDDEINRSVKGGDYGWNPVPGYNESVPMTDQALPGKQIDAVWSSGSPTWAISGITFLAGDQWGRFDGSLAVAALKDQSLHFFTFVDGEFVDVYAVDELDGTYGRLRGVTVGPDGALYVTTSTGEDDKILKVAPR